MHPSERLICLFDLIKNISLALSLGLYFLTVRAFSTPSTNAVYHWLITGNRCLGVCVSSQIKQRQFQVPDVLLLKVESCVLIRNDCLLDFSPLHNSHDATPCFSPRDGTLWASRSVHFCLMRGSLPIPLSLESRPKNRGVRRDHHLPELFCCRLILQHRLQSMMQLVLGDRAVLNGVFWV